MSEPPMEPGVNAAPPPVRPRVEVRAMRRDDLDEVVAIERAAQPHPWPPEVFLEELHRGWARVEVLREASASPPDVDGLAAIVGFINYWIVGDEIHVLDVAVLPAARRRGHARTLLEHAHAEGRAAGCRCSSLEVRRHNRGALRLYRGFGYRPVGVRPRYYDNGDDAIVMVAELG